MRKTFVMTLFLLAVVGLATAQQPGGPPSAGATPGTSPGAGASTAPGTGPSTMQGPSPNVAVTQGCLGGSNPNYTITDQSGKTYKLNIPPNADASKLGQHIGEPVQVAGNVNDRGAGSSSIDVRGIGRGTGQCPAGAKTPKQ